MNEDVRLLNGPSGCGVRGGDRRQYVWVGGWGRGGISLLMTHVHVILGLHSPRSGGK